MRLMRLKIALDSNLAAAHADAAAAKKRRRSSPPKDNDAAPLQKADQKADQKKKGLGGKADGCIGHCDDDDDDDDDDDNDEIGGDVGGRGPRARNEGWMRVRAEEDDDMPLVKRRKTFRTRRDHVPVKIERVCKAEEDGVGVDGRVKVEVLHDVPVRIKEEVLDTGDMFSGPLVIKKEEYGVEAPFDMCSIVKAEDTPALASGSDGSTAVVGEGRGLATAEPEEKDVSLSRMKEEGAASQRQLSACAPLVASPPPSPSHCSSTRPSTQDTKEDSPLQAVSCHSAEYSSIGLKLEDQYF